MNEHSPFFWCWFRSAHWFHRFFSFNRWPAVSVKRILSIVPTEGWGIRHNCCSRSYMCSTVISLHRSLVKCIELKLIVVGLRYCELARPRFIVYGGKLRRERESNLLLFNESLKPLTNNAIEQRKRLRDRGSVL